MGDVQVMDIMSDEKVDVGDQVVTSGGDRIYPKGMPVGTVTSVAPDRENDPFLAIKLKTAADLNRLEEVLVVIKTAEETPAASTGPAPADTLAPRLPIATKPNQTVKTPSGIAPAEPALSTPGGISGKGKPSGSGTEQGKAAVSGQKAAVSAHNPPAGPSPTPNPDGPLVKKPKVPASRPGAALEATPQTKRPDDPEKPPR
jgi:rod shape-determining protein MreC